MKRFVSPLILIVAMIVAAGFPGTAMAQGNRTGTSAVTVEVSEYIAIPATPPAMTINVVTPGTEATGTSVFDVNANVATTISVGTIVTPSGLTTGTLTADVSPTSPSTPGTAQVTLTGRITVLITEPVGTYSGGSITVTVTVG